MLNIKRGWHRVSQAGLRAKEQPWQILAGLRAMAHQRPACRLRRHSVQRLGPAPSFPVLSCLSLHLPA